MDNLIRQIEDLQKSPIRDVIDKRLLEFESWGKMSYKEWFSELCFCLLTANSRAKTAINIQKELEFEGFLNKSFDELSFCIRKNKHRFHNVKAKYIVFARKYVNIKEILEFEGERREWLVKNILGLGYKEASHFLRNIGFFDYAILDRHIINLMFDEGLIDARPKSLNRKVYLEIEGLFREIAKRCCMSLAELDLYMWYIKTGEVLK